MKKTVKNYCLNATAAKLDELYEIAKRYAVVKNEIFHRYSSVSGLGHLSYPKKIRDEWVKNKYGDRFGLQARYWKQALDEAFANINSKWSNTAKKVKNILYRNQLFSEEEKHYAFYILKSADLLYQALTYSKFPFFQEFKNKQIRRQKVHKYLKSRLRKYFGKKPYQRRQVSFVLDKEMYNTKLDEKGRQWVAVMGLKPRKRIKLLMSSSEPLAGNLRIVLKGQRIEVHKAVEVECGQPQGSNVVAVDKGFKCVFTASSGVKYGEGFNEMLKEESDRLSVNNKRRNKLSALVAKYEERGNIIKAELIKRNNLGKKKYYRQKENSLNRIKRFINFSLNEFFVKEKPAVLVTEDLTFSNWSKKLSKKVKRYLSSWLKGYMRKQIDFKAKLNGVQQVVVNPAYTSQTCYLCGAFGVRRDDKFYCVKHGEVDADYNASRNTLSRTSDPEINRYTPYLRVKQILQARLRLSNHDSRNPNIHRDQSESELTHTYI